MVVGKLKPASSSVFTALGEQLQAKPISTPKTHPAPALLSKPKPGLIDAPVSKMSTPKPEATQALKLPSPFKSFMTIDSYDVTIARPDGSSEVARVSALRGKGDNCTMVVPVILNEDGTPSLLTKDGNTRAAHELREPGSYVRMGMVGGRWDKEIGADPAGIAKKIGIAELAEEIGARAVKGGAFVLGDTLMATMPGVSTEADLPVGVVAAFVPGDKITGDMSGMEVVGLMKPTLLSVADAFDKARSGEISEGPRFETYARRCLDKFGFIPELNAYVFDLPPALKNAFKANGTLGIGAAVDPRKLVAAGEFESAGEVAHAPGGDAFKAKPKVDPSAINGVEFVESKRVDVPGFGTMFDAKTDHLAKQGGKSTRAEMTHPNQLLHLDFDLAKVAVYYEDPVQGPMVRLSDVERPIMAAKELALADEIAYKKEHYALTRRDLPEVKVELPFDGASSPAELMEKAGTFDAAKLAKTAVVDALKAGHVDAEVSALGAAGFASPGGCDLQHHFFAAKLKSAPTSTEGFVRLSDAIRIMRQGEGDPAAEAGLLRLASAVGWIPSLGMSTQMAKLQLNKFADD